MKTKKEQYINEEVAQLIKRWSSITFLIGASLFLLLGIMDYFSTPENFKRFMTYRVVASFSLASLAFINKKISHKYQHIVVLTVIMVSAITIEAMILSFGGHKSTYYAGMIILIVCVFGLIPLDLLFSILGIAIVYFIYIVPILLFDKVTDFQTFFSSNSFLISFFIIAVIWRYFNQKIVVSELSLKYDLEEQKKQLEVYSHELEDMVEKRTKDLSISEQRFRALFDYANDGVVVFDKDGIILDVNKKFCELHGFKKNTLIGTHIKLLDTEQKEDKNKERIDRVLNGEILLYEAEDFKKDGTRILLEISLKAIDIGGELVIQSFHRDLSDRKKLQEQLFQSQKMESMGMLAGGVAHDFNNMLTAILGHAELLHEHSNLDATAKQRVKNIESASRKAGHMVSRLLSFAHKSKSEIAPFNLNDVINDTIELIGKVIASKKIDIKKEMDNDLPSIDGDSNQLEQVIMNLVVNARDAMPEGGVITIKTYLADLEKEAALIHPLLTPGKYIVLTVSDNGTGIPDEIKNKIFEPFFTTKEAGKGTGLGLAMVYGIVKEHRGIVEVKSELGKGTTFEVYLPASDRFVHKVEKPSSYSKGGREHILVIDDETDILNFIKDTLDAHGYKVFVTNNPIYAVDILKKIADDVDLVITDIVMPLISGRELIRYLKMIKPGLKIIAISGYDAKKTGRQERDIDAFIKKPFENVYLLDVVRRVLDLKVKKS